MRHKAVRASCIPQTIHLSAWPNNSICTRAKITSTLLQNQGLIEGRNTCQVLPLLVDMCLNSLAATLSFNLCGSGGPKLALTLWTRSATGSCWELAFGCFCSRRLCLKVNTVRFDFTG